MKHYSEKAKRTRERILDAANELFFVHGYNATGLEKIIAAAGVTKGNFYYYFKTKEDLAVEALKWQRELSWQALGVDRPLGSESPLQRLFEVIDALKGQVVVDGTCEVRGCYFGNLSLEMSAASEKVRTELVRTFQGMREHFAGLIAKAREVGEVPAHVEPQMAAATVLSLLEGAVLMSKTVQDIGELDRAIAFIREYLTR